MKRPLLNISVYILILVAALAYIYINSESAYRYRNIGGGFILISFICCSILLISRVFTLVLKHGKNAIKEFSTFEPMPHTRMKNLKLISLLIAAGVFLVFGGKQLVLYNSNMAFHKSPEVRVQFFDFADPIKPRPLVTRVVDISPHEHTLMEKYLFSNASHVGIQSKEWRLSYIGGLTIAPMNSDSPFFIYYHGGSCVVETRRWRWYISDYDYQRIVGLISAYKLDSFQGTTWVGSGYLNSVTLQKDGDFQAEGSLPIKLQSIEKSQVQPTRISGFWDIAQTNAQVTITGYVTHSDGYLVKSIPVFRIKSPIS